MILVVGATGLLGGEICRRLATRSQPVRALVRSTSNPAKIENLKSLGTELVQGDLRDPTSLDAACQGITTIISGATINLSSQPGDTVDSVDREGQLHLIDAALAAGVAHFIYISYSGNMDTPSPMTAAKRLVEERLKQSGLTYTILRPSFFMEVLLSPAAGFDMANAKAQIYGSGRNPISWISMPDIAQFAVLCVDNPAARNKTFELGGPEALSQLDAVRIFEEVSGRSFEVNVMPDEVLRAQLAAATNSVQQSFLAMLVNYAKGDPIDMQATLHTFPMHLTSLQEYAQRMMHV